MKIEKLDNAFPIVAAVLGRKFGVNVRVGGAQAFTDGKTITVPAYNKNDPYVKDIAWGYLAHEAAHIRLSDFGVFKRVSTSPIRKKLVNILEDVRIEQGIIRLYPGTFYTIQRMDEHLFTSPVSKEDGPASILTGYMLYSLARDVHGFTGLRKIAMQSQAVLEETFSSGVVTKLMGMMSLVPNLTSTQDAIHLADRILTMLEDERDEAESQKDQNGQPQPDQSEPEPGEQPASGEDEPSGNGTNPSNADPVSILDSVLNATEDQLPVDPSKMIESILSGQEPRDYDKEIRIPLALKPERNGAMGLTMIRKVSTQTARLRMSLQNLVQSHQQNNPSLRRSGNRLDGNRLHRVVSGNPTVFRKNEIQEFPNTDIEILIDGSKSMTDENFNGETRIQLAMEASLALALALEGIDGVTPSVTRFPYRSTSDVIQVLKHGERVQPNASAFLPIANGDTTPLHVALWYVASSILNGQGNRKIVFVLFDGKPNDPEATLAVIKRCEAAGIEFVGVGIGLDVSNYFKTNIKINNINDITGELFRISRKLLIAA